MVPVVSHHVTQRGDRRQRIFSEGDDDRRYRGLISALPGATGEPRDLFLDK